MSPEIPDLPPVEAQSVGDFPVKEKWARPLVDLDEFSKKKNTQPISIIQYLPVCIFEHFLTCSSMNIYLLTDIATMKGYAKQDTADFDS